MLDLNKCKVIFKPHLQYFFLSTLEFQCLICSEGEI